MINDHPYEGELRSGASCQFVYGGKNISEVCARQAMEHETAYQTDEQFAQTKAELATRHRQGSESNAGLYGPPTSPKAKVLEEAAARGTDVVRAADAAQYARPAIPEEQRGQIRVRLLNATPDPLGSVAALIEQYKGNVIRSLSDVTDEQRRAALADMGKTVLSGPLEAVQFHWQIEGVTRSITHQMVRSRASFFAQESLRFAVPEGNWAQEIPLPPSLAGVKRREFSALLKSEQYAVNPASDGELMLDAWDDAMINAQNAYTRLIDLGMPAEEARGVLPHDMPTRIHWVCDLRTLLAEAGKRTCTQAQFPWRMIFAGMASALRGYVPPYAAAGEDEGGYCDASHDVDLWQFREIANALRPVCFQTGQCGFMAQFDRSCSIRGRVDAFAAAGVPSSEWGHDLMAANQYEDGAPDIIQVKAIHDYEWAADPSAARS
jgi:flavin-dependent thymidylate synthase